MAGRAGGCGEGWGACLACLPACLPASPIASWHRLHAADPTKSLPRLHTNPTQPRTKRAPTIQPHALPHRRRVPGGGGAGRTDPAARASSVVTVSHDGWYSGRATFFGASDELVSTFERIRGPGSYGDLHYGSCGYFNKPQGIEKIRPQDLPFDQTYAAAAADVNPDFPGSCGRCYEIRCKQGVVPKDFTDASGAMVPFKTQDHFYMPKYDTSLKDGQGRTWPGNPWEAEGLQGAVCWSNTSTTWVRIVDSCPPNPNSPWCAAASTVAHFDLSYWAFEKLAHPLYGVMPIEFRPIDCDTKQSLPYLPGSISKTIYKDGPSPGWSLANVEVWVPTV